MANCDKILVMKDQGEGISEEIANFFNEAMKTDRLSHCYIFSGGDRLSVNDTALSIGASILGIKKDNRDDYQNPDLIITSGITSKIEDIRDLIKKLNLKPYQSDKKVAIILDADKLSIESLNTLLKTLEEPAEKTHIILTATNYQSLPSTVRSRGQLIKINKKIIKASDDGAIADEEEGVPVIDFLNLSRTEMLARAGSLDAAAIILDLSNIFQDIIYIKKDSQTLVSGNYDLELLQQVEKKYDLEKVCELLMLLIKYQPLLNTNTNQKILLENIILNL